MNKSRVLVVEDDQVLRELICQKLRQLDYDVDEAEDGQKGLERITQHRPDLIITDVVMPDMDGNKMLKVLRESASPKQIPIVVITARIMMRDYFEMMQVDAFIEKPFKMDDLIIAIEQTLLKHHSPEQGKAIKQPEKSDKVAISDQAEKVIKDSIVDLPWHDQDEHVREKKALGKIQEPKRWIPPSKGKIIFALDRNRDIWPDVKRILAELGFSIDFFEDVTLFGKATLEKPPDLILICQLTRLYNALILAKGLKRSVSLYKVPIFIYDKIGELTKGINESGKLDTRFILNSEGRQIIKKIIETFAT